MKHQEIITSAIFLDSLLACKTQIEPMQIETVTEKTGKHKILFNLPIKIYNYFSIFKALQMD